MRNLVDYYTENERKTGVLILMKKYYRKKIFMKKKELIKLKKASPTLRRRIPCRHLQAPVADLHAFPPPPAISFRPSPPSRGKSRFSTRRRDPKPRPPCTSGPREISWLENLFSSC
jgi:hypothetical protein